MNAIEKEKRTVERMIRLYCKHNHSTELCAGCEELIRYAHAQLDTCVFGKEKPSCRQCVVHCYTAERREKIRQVMRYSGPRIWFYQPFYFLKHWFRELNF